MGSPFALLSPGWRRYVKTTMWGGALLGAAGTFVEHVHAHEERAKLALAFRAAPERFSKDALDHDMLAPGDPSNVFFGVPVALVACDVAFNVSACACMGPMFPVLVVAVAKRTMDEARRHAMFMRFLDDAIAAAPPAALPKYRSGRAEETD